MTDQEKLHIIAKRATTRFQKSEHKNSCNSLISLIHEQPMSAGTARKCRIHVSSVIGVLLLVIVGLAALLGLRHIKKP